MDFETFALGLLAAMASDEIVLRNAVAFEGEIDLGFGLGHGLELALSSVDSRGTLPVRTHIK